MGGVWYQQRGGGSMRGASLIKEVVGMENKATLLA